jgi:hypothetical protein
MANEPTYNISPLLRSALFNSGVVIVTGSASLSIESDLTVSATAIFSQSIAMDGEGDFTASAFAIKSASASLDGLLDVSIATPVRIDIAGAVSLSISSNFIIPDLIRFTPSVQNPGSYIPLVLLDGVPLTDQNRKFNNSNKPVFVEKSNWNSSKSRYYKRATSGKQSFKLSWEWLPSDKENTIDKRQARNFIKEKSMDPDYHTLTVIKYGENPEDVFEETEYNVFITNYSEDLIRRDLGTGTYFWRCDVELEEI